MPGHKINGEKGFSGKSMGGRNKKKPCFLKSKAFKIAACPYLA
jgi:hypothetical protein